MPTADLGGRSGREQGALLPARLRPQHGGAPPFSNRSSMLWGAMGALLAWCTLEYSTSQVYAHARSPPMLQHMDAIECLTRCADCRRWQSGAWHVTQMRDRPFRRSRTPWSSCTARCAPPTAKRAHLRDSLDALSADRTLENVVRDACVGVASAVFRLGFTDHFQAGPSTSSSHIPVNFRSGIFLILLVPCRLVCRHAGRPLEFGIVELCSVDLQCVLGAAVVGSCEFNQS